MMSSLVIGAMSCLVCCLLFHVLFNHDGSRVRLGLGLIRLTVMIKT